MNEVKILLDLYLIQNYVVPSNYVITCISVAISSDKVSSESLEIAADHVISCEQYSPHS